MNWSADETRVVGNALLGSWPGTVTAWGRDAFAAYVGELQARGLEAESVLIAIRTWPAGSDFPPSAPNLAAQATKDPSRPTFEEAYSLIYGRGGVLRARMPYTGPVVDAEARRDDAARARMGEVHPLVASFIDRFGLGRLRVLEVDHEIYGDLKRKELRDAWTRHVDATEGREVAAIASGRRDGLRGLDPLSALGGKRERPQIEARS